MLPAPRYGSGQQARNVGMMCISFAVRSIRGPTRRSGTTPAPTPLAYDCPTAAARPTATDGVVTSLGVCGRTVSK
jgi:hypothetical protein